MSKPDFADVGPFAQVDTIAQLLHRTLRRVQVEANQRLERERNDWRLRTLPCPLVHTWSVDHPTLTYDFPVTR